MIEFKGRLSGAAEKRFWQKASLLVQNYVLVAMILNIPMIIMVAQAMRNHAIYMIYAACIAIFLLIVWLPKPKKERKAMTPNRIYVEDESITCVAEQYTETKWVSDVVKVIEYDEFYELVFPFGKITEKFICQKDLLTMGTLEEFEALFEGKIVRSPSK